MRPDFDKFDRSIAATVKALQRGDHPKALSLEDFAAELDALAAARRALIEVFEECVQERRRMERASVRYGDVLRRVATERKARRIAKVRKPTMTREQWTAGLSQIMTEVRRRENERAISEFGL